MEGTKDNMQTEKALKRKMFLKRGFLLLRLTGIVIFIIILTRVDLGELWLRIRGADTALFATGLGFQVLLLFLKAYRWYLLNPGAKQKNMGHSFGQFFESYAIGVITPGRMGEILKAGYAGKRTGVLGSGIRVIVERGLDLGFFLLVAGSSIAFASLVRIDPFWGWLLMAGGLAVVTVAVLLLVSKRALGPVNSILQKIKVTREPIVYSEQKTTDNLMIFLLSAGSNLSYFVSCYFLGLSVFMDASFLYLSGGVAIAGMLNMLPVTVMGLGTRELTFLYVFNEFSRPLVLAFSGLVFLVAQVGGGLISLVAGELFLLASKTKKR
jgi:uncharacterized protein (TIRG00374 family)